MKIKLREITWLAVLLINCWPAYGQRFNQYHAEVGGLVSSDQTPFWLRANQYGTVPLSVQNARLSAGFRSDYISPDSTGSRLKADWGYGLEAWVNVGKTNQIFFPEAYLKGRLGVFEMYVGRRREVVGLVDTSLTMGAYAWSGNALPIPKVQLGVPNFTPIPLTKGILSFMGAYAHGWFENSGRLVKGSYLHQKYLYSRLGKPTWSFRLYAGFNHQVIWAGQAAPGILSPLVSIDGRLPSTFQYYPAVITGTRGQFDPNDPNVTSFEDNRIGNHLGSVDLGTDIDLNNLNLFVYRQFLYDDGSLFYLTNLRDGLNGLRIKNRQIPSNASFFLRQITIEYLFTGGQGGDEFVIEENLRRGRDNYFNHSQFIDGWTYFGRTIGTPFITTANEVTSSLPKGTPIANNRVSAYHLGINGLLFGKVDLTTRLSYSLNAGLYSAPYLTIPKQFSGLLSASVPLGGVVLNGSVALDTGGLLPNSVGAYVGLRKTGFLGRVARQPATTMRFN